MEERAQPRVEFSHMAVLAVFSVVALIVVAGSQIYSAFLQKNPELIAAGTGDSSSRIARTPYGSINWQVPLSGIPIEGTAGGGDDPDGVGNIGNNVAEVLLSSYAALEGSGTYTPEAAADIAGNIAASLRASVSYKEFAAADLEIDEDTSYERMLEYRGDLRVALEPLLENPGYELSLFANYIESQDVAYLNQLRETAENYHAAVAQAGAIAVPQDAVAEHVEILNALSEFGTVVERLTIFADDAFATAALLRTYNESEARLFVSFNTLAEYYRGKPQS